MESLIGGDQRISGGIGFPQDISPFPEPESLFFSNASAAIHSPSPQPPPQKLRPIRASGRSPCSSQGNDLSLSSGGLDGSLENLGLLVEQVCGMNGENSEIFKTLMKAEDSEAQRAGSGRRRTNLDPNCGGCSTDNDDSSSSSDDDDTSSAFNGQGSGKRRRKRRKKLDDFLESLVMKVLDKQEEMNKQLIETIERKERERVFREEAWKQLEMERIKRDDDIRAQENARNMALISFIEDVMGHKVEFSQPLTMFSHDDKSEEKELSNVFHQKDFNSDSNSRRWPKAEVQALIMLRAASEQKFRAMGGKSSNIWDEISAGMCDMGYYRTAKKCKEKWENINKYFRKSMGNGEKKRNETSKTCPYFHELDILYKNGFVNPGTLSDHSNMDNAINGS